MNRYETIDCYYEPLKIMDEFSDKKSEMKDSELGFLCGLIKKCKPQKIVEVGIAAGGTTAVILNCIEKLELNCEMYSVDLSKKYYRDERKETGFLVNETRGNKQDRHRFMLGKVLPEWIDEIGDGIDFLILDTMHVLPGEVIDFLVAFPYLKSDATVVLHDTVFQHIWKYKSGIATSVLFQSVAAKKILNNQNEYPNIAAFQINSDTEKYIQDVFNSLIIPWEYIPDNSQIEQYIKIYEKYYSDDCIKMFHQTLSLSVDMEETAKQKSEVMIQVDDFLYSLNESLINSFSHILLYGAGKRGTSFCKLAIEKDINIDGYVVSDGKKETEAIMDKPVYEISNIPYEREEVLIIKTVNSNEVSRLLKEAKYHWIEIPVVFWKVIENR